MASDGILPSGGSICCSFPDLLFLPELVFGGLVWILVACTYINPNNPQAYVMAVSLFCFIFTFIWMSIFSCGAHGSRSSCAGADVLYHGFAALLYLSASVLLAFTTVVIGFIFNNSPILTQEYYKFYRLDISAVVFSFIATLLYVIHTIFSAIRWKSF
ncbi:myelin and lymphocyte protein-like [Trichomycterus rosablanca]|uniref:myelin and lymphocyte protein-like n=1 Tax=Trichomycterus rosablanca TaxID=2290929 RepID=UPI002F35D13A